MPKKVCPGDYKVGRVEPEERSRHHGTYGVIRGDTANQDGREEWRHLCDGALYKSKWYAYRIYRKRSGVTGGYPKTALLVAKDSKSDAVDWLQNKHGDRFDETF